MKGEGMCAQRRALATELVAQCKFSCLFACLYIAISAACG